MPAVGADRGGRDHLDAGADGHGTTLGSTPGSWWLPPQSRRCRCARRCRHPLVGDSPPARARQGAWGHVRPPLQRPRGLRNSPKSGGCKTGQPRTLQKLRDTFTDSALLKPGRVRCVRNANHPSSEGVSVFRHPRQRTHVGSELGRAGSFAGYHGFTGALGSRCSQRQGDGERGAFADAVAGRGDASVVGLNQRLNDG